jgi:hypothetical protein
MTRAELKQVRAALAECVEFGCRVAHALPNSDDVWQDAWPENWGIALKLLDAELAKRYLCTVEAEVIEAESEAEALEAMMERLKLGAVVVSMVEIEGEKQ